MDQKINSTYLYDEKELSKELSSLQNIDSLGTQLSSILGLDDLEAKIYLNLLRVGPISASALAKDIDIERTKMYNSFNYKDKRIWFFGSSEICYGYYNCNACH